MLQTIIVLNTYIKVFNTSFYIQMYVIVHEFVDSSKRRRVSCNHIRLYITEALTDICPLSHNMCMVLPSTTGHTSSWWRHQMETFPAFMAPCAGNSPMNSPHKGQWHGASMLSLICAWTNDWVNDRQAGDLRRRRAHYDVNVMFYYLVPCGHCRMGISRHVALA